MEQHFANHFAALADSYQAFRPCYPDKLYTWLAALAPHRDLVWDCACGNGQASVGLAAHFRQVVATDASREQIVAAKQHPRIEYRVASAGASGLPAGSAGLVTVAQALHWFDLPPFYSEVQRVLCPGGVLAVWTYGTLAVTGEDVDRLIQHFYQDIVGPYWPSERAHVEDGYRSLAFPYDELTCPKFTMEASWNLSQLLGYLRSWSASGRFESANGFNPVDDLAHRLAPVWGDPEQCRLTTWPLSLRVGRKL